MWSVRVIGGGRAGGALATALGRVGWRVDGVLGRGGDLTGAAAGVDLLVIATPDDVIGDVASAVAPVATAVVAHLAGSLGLSVLDPHPVRAAVHPLVAMPTAEVGAGRLVGAWFASTADEGRGELLAEALVADLGGRSFPVADGDRAGYHAAAVIASNHLVALLGQAERVAATAGVPLAVYLDLVRATVENVAELGPVRALTGPASRGDRATLDRHRAALAAGDPSELPLYDALVAAAQRMAAERDD